MGCQCVHTLYIVGCHNVTTILHLMPNNRGAQPSNTNAYQHGFYSRHQTAVEWSDSDQGETDSLASEIDALRVLIRRLDNSKDPGHTETDLAALLNCSLAASARLSTLLRLQLILNDRPAGIKHVLDKALDNVWFHFGPYAHLMTSASLEALRVKLRSPRRKDV